MIKTIAKDLKALFEQVKGSVLNTRLGLDPTQDDWPVTSEWKPHFVRTIKKICVRSKLSMASKWNLYIYTLHMYKLYFVSGCFSFSSAIRSGRTIVKQDLGCACRELKYEIKSGDSLCKTLTPYFSSSSSGTVGPRPLKKMYWYQSIRTYPCIRDGFLLWILLGSSDRKSHMSSCGEHPGAVGGHLVEVRDHWPELHLSQG